MSPPPGGVAGPGPEEAAPASRWRKGPLAWMASNPVAANLLMLTLLVGGLLMSQQLRKEVFPGVDIDTIAVTVAYPGASPAEVEQGIILAVEEAVQPLDGIKEVTSTALEGAGYVMAELEVGANKTKVLADVKNAVDRITTLPMEAERPLVNLPEWRADAISVVIYGDLDQHALFALGERLREGLLELPEISYVEMSGLRPLEISVEIPQDTLRQYGLTLGQAAMAIRRTAIERPAGGVKTSGGEVLLRTTERRDLGREFANIPVLTGSDGSPVPLGQLATIVDGFADTDVEAAFNGQPAVTVEVYSVGAQSPTDVARAVTRYVERLRPTLPPGVQITTWHDHAKLYQERLDLLLRNGAFGLVLVMFIIGLFLAPRLAFWVMMGIPISFLGSLLLLPSLDVSINMISLFAFIVTLGMVVDDAIVVGENTHRLQRQGMPPLEAAVRGARGVATPVFFSIATTLVAFTPLLFIPGVRGKFMVGIPMVVMTVLAISLVESFLVLPAHLGHLTPPRPRARPGLQERFSLGVERFVRRQFGPMVALVLRWRWITLALAITSLLCTFGLTAGGRIKYIDWPREESDRIRAEARLPFGAPVEETRAVMERMVKAAQEAVAQSGGPAICPGIFSMVGGSSRWRRGGGSHVVTVRLALVPTDQRKVSSFQLADRWRKEVGDIPGLESLTFDSSTGHYSKPIDLELGHSDPVQLEAAARELAAQLGRFTGVKDIDTGIELGKPQLDFTISPDGVSAGLTPEDLAGQVRAAFYGAQALRQQRGRHEVKVMVRLPRAERRSLSTVEELMVQTPAGGQMPLRQAARVEQGRAYSSINRTNGKRTARVQADVQEGQANAQEVVRTVLAKIGPRLKDTYPGLTTGLSGRQRENRDFVAYIGVAFPLALLVMYLLIAVPLRSYLQPLLVVMAAIPFGYIGAVLGHMLMGYPMSMVSLLGVVALSGVVVNDSIVLVDAANRFARQGASPMDAALDAAQQRFRPIVLTSLTTFGGLAPMIFETSLQARMLIPMAIALGFGVMFSTAVTLLLVPTFYLLTEELRAALRRAWGFFAER